MRVNEDKWSSSVDKSLETSTIYFIISKVMISCVRVMSVLRTSRFKFQFEKNLILQNVISKPHVIDVSYMKKRSFQNCD